MNIIRSAFAPAATMLEKPPLTSIFSQRKLSFSPPEQKITLRNGEGSNNRNMTQKKVIKGHEVGARGFVSKQTASVWRKLGLKMRPSYWQKKPLEWRSDGYVVIPKNGPNQCNEGSHILPYITLELLWTYYVLRTYGWDTFAYFFLQLPIKLAVGTRILTFLVCWLFRFKLKQQILKF